MTILIAGASGAIGREVAGLLAPSHRISVLARSERSLAPLPGPIDGRIAADLTKCGRELLDDALAGVQTVISCVGAPVLPGPGDRASFADTDTRANVRLIDAARANGVFRFLYMGVHRHDAYAHTAYLRAHERVAEELARSGMSYTVVEPTGVFSALLEFVRFARRGRVPLIGNGSARTNPVDPRDVARCVADHLSRGPERVPVGGPEILTRDAIAEAACRAIGSKPSLLHVPAGIVSAMAKLVRPFHARAGELMEFYSAVNTVDCIAPTYGTRRLADYFRDAVASGKA